MAPPTKAELLNELMAELEEESLKQKKFLVEENEEDNREMESIEEMTVVLDSLDDKIKDLACKEEELKEKLSSLQALKKQLRQEKLANDAESRGLQVDIESLNKECVGLKNQIAVYSNKIKQNGKPRPAQSDLDKLREAGETLNLLKKISGVKFTTNCKGKIIEGYVFNKSSSTLKRFSIENDAHAMEKLQKLIKAATHPDWTSIEKAILSELGYKV